MGEKKVCMCHPPHEEVFPVAGSKYLLSAYSVAGTLVMAVYTIIIDNFHNILMGKVQL